MNILSEAVIVLENLLADIRRDKEAYKEAVRILKESNTSVPLDKVIEELEINIEEE